MKAAKFLIVPAAVLATMAIATGCEAKGGSERRIVVLATNDIHGALEPGVMKWGETVGGMAAWGGILDSIRTGLEKQYGKNAGTLLLDGGDQFQGTLISNHNEGALMFEAMNHLGYDAVVPGNHNYDFGPVGWLEDEVGPESRDKNPRGALEALVARAKFPMLSANTYLKNSLRDAQGNKMEVENVGCKPVSAGARIDWKKARRPGFLRPWLIKEVAGVRVALIGLDGSLTPKTTNISNVSDLCFRREAETYEEVRKELDGKADVFVLVIHSGNSTSETELTKLVQRIAPLHGGEGVHAVVGGHTHFVNHEQVLGVPLVQSGANGEKFGRIDLVFDAETRRVLRDRTKSWAGLLVRHDGCDKLAADFCKKESGATSYEGEAFRFHAAVASLVAGGRQRIAALAGRRLGLAPEGLTRDRISESPLANLLGDMARAISGADISMLNNGGIRADVPKGEITYETLYRVLPFNNAAVTVGPMEWSRVKSILERNVKSCGRFGIVVPAGLRVEYARNCDKPVDGQDVGAYLLRVTTESGEVLFDKAAGIDAPAGRAFHVVTQDFAAKGGSGFDEFVGVPVKRNEGILRERLADELERRNREWPNRVDGRYREIKR
ncbi:MAG: bifunctional metallophosphatase/5'-nucleotidase [Bdellovibrionales bacterium]|nr:bifunctional metallophosphatase/5'-nucleotidase [Bdellovibrionales bacterium]